MRTAWHFCGRALLAHWQRPRQVQQVWRLQSIIPSNTFSTSSVRSGNRAIVYNSNGDPERVLSVISFPELAPPPPDTVNIKLLLAPINPADINVIEGIYPTKPHPDVSLSRAKDHPVFVGGNEGLAEVTEVGEGVTGLRKGDWVLLTKAQSGTWSSTKNVASSDILKVPKEGLSEVQAATITVRLDSSPRTCLASALTFNCEGKPLYCLQYAARLRTARGRRLDNSKWCKQCRTEFSSCTGGDPYS